jgi:ClpP class serine protease
MNENIDTAFSAGSTWAMLPATLAAVARGARIAEPPGELVNAFISRRGISRYPGAFGAGIVAGVGIVPIFGAIYFRAQWALLAADFGALLDDPEVRAIVIDVDSPGGLVAGTAEFADLIFAARGRKPIVAHAGGWAASASYWVAAAADELVISETGAAGSIGVAALYWDMSKMLANAGIREIEVISSQSPAKNLDPALPEGRALVQRRVDDLAAVFVDRVAKFRGTTADDVLENFGQGDLLVGARAVDAGLADRIGTFEQLLDKYRVASSSSPAPVTVSLSPRELGATRERARITSILDITPPGAEALAARAIAIGATRDDFAMAALRSADPAELQAGATFDASGQPLVLAQAHADFDGAVEFERLRVAAITDLQLPRGFDNERSAAIRDGRTPAEFAADVVAIVRDRGPLASIEALEAGGQSVPHGGDANPHKPDRPGAAWDKTVKALGG